MTLRVQPTVLPQPSLVAAAFARTDYADAYRVRLPGNGPYDVADVTRALFTARPGWIDRLMDLRHLLVRPFGLKVQTGRTPAELPPLSFTPGTRAGIFRVYERNAQEILMGENDRHLDFRLAIQVEQTAAGAWATASTVVRYNGLLGRAYFFFVRPFHKLIVPAMLRNMQRQLRKATYG